MAGALPKPKIPKRFSQQSLETYFRDLIDDVFVDFVNQHKEITSGDVAPDWQWSLDHHTKEIAKLTMRWYKDNRG